MTAREMFYGDSEGDMVEMLKLNSLFPPSPNQGELEGERSFSFRLKFQTEHAYFNE